MKIVLLTQWYPPEPAKLISDLAETIQQSGHEITVLTAFPNYPSGKLYPGYKLRFWQREEINGIPIVRVPLYASHNQSAGKRILNYISFSQSAAMLGPCLLSKPDVVHVYHPPMSVAWPAWLLSRWWRVPFTYEIQDIWPETLKATGMLNNERMLRLIGWFAKRVYSKAEAIRVISPGFRDNLVEKGVPAEKIHVVSNWVDTEIYKPSQANKQLAESLGLAGRFNIMFAGNVGLAQGCEVIVEAADMLRDLSQVQFVFVGSGADLERIQNIVRDKNLSNVIFLGRYPQEAMPDLYPLADVLLLTLRDDPLFRITIPHKILTYLACGKPILASLAGNAADVVEQAGAGLICPPGNAQALADAVRRFVSMSCEQMLQMSENGRKAAIEQYEKKYLVAKMIDMMKKAVANRKA